MPVASNTFSLLSGTPTAPIFAEIAVKGHSVESDGGVKPFVNIFHFNRESGPGVGTELELHSAFMTIIAVPMGAVLSASYVADFNIVRFMDNPLNAGVPFANPIIGQVAGDRLPNFNASVIRKNTYARGRSYRGSNHYGPIAESDTLLDNLTAGALVFLQALATALTSCGGAGGGVTLPGGDVWRLSVFSTVLSNFTSNPIQVTGSWVNATVANQRLGTMRRRKDRTGPSA